MKTKRNYKVRGYVSILCLVISFTLSIGYLIGQFSITRNQDYKVLPVQKINQSVTNTSHHRLMSMVDQTEMNEFYKKVKEMELETNVVELGLNGDALSDECLIFYLVDLEGTDQYIHEVEDINLDNNCVELGLNNDALGEDLFIRNIMIKELITQDALNHCFAEVNKMKINNNVVELGSNEIEITLMIESILDENELKELYTKINQTQLNDNVVESGFNSSM